MDSWKVSRLPPSVYVTIEAKPFSPTAHGALMEDLARQTGAAVVFPYYTPAPEAQYPVQFEQVYGVLEHFVSNGDKYDLKVDRFGLAGDSVGGEYKVPSISSF